MRIFVAGISTETNTFAPWPTGLRGFDEGGLYRGTASREDHGTNGLVARLWKALALENGHELVEGLFANAEPSGPTVQHVWEALRDEIVTQAGAEGPFDVILLLLHGAMVSTACDDCEADLVERLRVACGPDVAIGVELDPHCHLSRRLVDAAALHCRAYHWRAATTSVGFFAFVATDVRPMRGFGLACGFVSASHFSKVRHAAPRS